jgi:predicted AAA+ superfamily ATPase
VPHQRPRHLLSLLDQRLRHFPIVGVLGARQTGKSTLIRELLGRKRSLEYITLDREEDRAEAIRSPSLFVQELESKGRKTVVIDEVQKAPVLFDTLKAEVDEDRRPGRFLITGSTEFSKKSGIRESLTGRIALTRLYPLNLAEIQESANARFPLAALSPHSGSKEGNRDIKLWLNRGGMPGIFAVRDEASRTAQWDAWIETTCFRDLTQFDIRRFKPELALRLFGAIARAETPTRQQVAGMLGVLPRQIDSYLDALLALHVIYEIPPHPSGTGKAQYHLLDAGIARSLGASESRCLEIWFLNEVFSQFSYAGHSRPFVFHYLSSKHSKVNFVVEHKARSAAFLLLHEEAPREYSLRAAASFCKKNPKIPVQVLAPCLRSHRLEPGCAIHPWSAVI